MNGWNELFIGIPLAILGSIVGMFLAYLILSPHQCLNDMIRCGRYVKSKLSQF